MRAVITERKFLNALELHVRPLRRVNMAEEVNKELHEIFTIDPLELKRYVGCYVQVTLASGKNILGIVYTIDPVSQSIILIGKENKFINMKIIFKNLMNSMNIIPEVPDDLKDLELSDLFVDSKGKRSLSEIKERKEKVKSWLLKNLITVEEKGEVLVLDTLEIHPPYSIDSCLCGNAIVLDRVQTLLKQLKLD